MCQARQRLLEVTDFPRRLSSSAATVEVLRLVHEMKTVSTSSLEPTFIPALIILLGLTPATSWSRLRLNVSRAVTSTPPCFSRAATNMSFTCPTYGVTRPTFLLPRALNAAVAAVAGVVNLALLSLEASCEKTTSSPSTAEADVQP